MRGHARISWAELVLVFTIGSALLVLTAGLLAASLRPLSFTGFLLAAYLVACGELVGLAETLSPLHAVTRSGYLGGLVTTAAVAAALWWACGRPGPPRINLEGFRGLRSHPSVCVLAFAVLFGLVFEFALGVTTAPNNWDSMVYHLARAAAWRQMHAVQPIPNANAPLGINASPPDSEIQLLFGLVLSGRDTFTRIPQLLASCALVASVFGIARRVGFGFVPALFAALVTATLPEIVLQSVTAQNDLAVAAPVTAAAFFLLGTKASEARLTGLAVGLALGTKVSAALILPGLGLLALAAGGWRRLLTVAAWSAAGFAALGSYIYVRSLHNAHEITSVPAGSGSMRAEPSVIASVSTAARTLYKFVDLSGLNAVTDGGKGIPVVLVLPIFVLAVGGTLWSRSSSRRFAPYLVSTGVALAAPLAAVVIGVCGWALLRMTHLPLNPAAATYQRFEFPFNNRADEALSYYGPLGVLLVWPLAVGVGAAWARRRIDGRLGALACILPIYLLLFAATLSYTPYVGRYFIAPVALVMPLAGLLAARPLVMRATAIVAIAFLVLVNVSNRWKPIGLAGTRPIWSLSRTDVQAIEWPAMKGVLSRVQKEVPSDARVGLVLRTTDWSYPFWDADLSRTVAFLNPTQLRTEADKEHLQWLIVHEREPHGSHWRWSILRLNRSQPPTTTASAGVRTSATDHHSMLRRPPS